ncbi:hypothetical protein AbraIFM66950_006462 [Aspergillus brasiliensis]|nr:hypothetical protein AbraIFM66950_006462 [Aspergillus brasiliensis]
MQQPARKAACGIDYGTTGTAVAWGLDYGGPGEFPAIDQLRHWPAQDAIKVPSRIQYPEALQSRWGFETTPELETYQWTKFLLDNSLEARDLRDEELEDVSGQGLMRLPAGKSAARVVGDYLGHIRKQIQALPGFRREDPVRKEYWFAIPASWANDAQQQMQEAIRLAGFGEDPHEEVCIVTENEASAISMIEADGRHVEPGNTLCVCDVGGGTICNEHITVAHGTEQRHEPQGWQYSDRTGVHETHADRFNRSFTSVFSASAAQREGLMSDFGRIKRRFTGNGASHFLTFHMDCYASEYYDYEPLTGQITLSDDDLRTLFGHVIDKVIKVVNDQLSRTTRGHFKIDKLLMTGGLMHSEYVRKMISDAFKFIGFEKILFSENL